MSDRYSITFRVSGGSPHDSLIEKLGLQPRYRRHLGGEIRNRKGEYIGTFDRNFTAVELPESVIVEHDFHQTLSNFLDQIAAATTELTSLVAEGAKTDLYLVLFGKSGGGESFPADLLARVASLHLTLSLTYVIQAEAPDASLEAGSPLNT